MVVLCWQYLVPNTSLALAALGQKHFDDSLESLDMHALCMLLFPYGIHLTLHTAYDATQCADQIHQASLLPLTRDTFMQALQFLKVVHFSPFIAASHLCLTECVACADEFVKFLCSYFHGRIPKEDAESLVLQQGSGSYLLRWSATMPGVYFIVVSEKQGKRVRHVRIDCEEEDKVCNNRGGRRVAVMMPREERIEGSEATRVRRTARCGGCDAAAISA